MNDYKAEQEKARHAMDPIGGITGGTVNLRIREFKRDNKRTRGDIKQDYKARAWDWARKQAKKRGKK